MKSSLLTVLGACALSLSSALAAAAAPTKAPATAPAKTAAPAVKGVSDEARIRVLENRFAAAFRAKDLAAIMSIYAPEGLFVFDIVPPRQYVGYAAYKKDWAGLLAQAKGPIRFDIQDLKIAVSGDMAYSHSVQPSSWTSVKGQPTSLTVRVTDVYRKIGGAWKIVHEHVSVPVDMATGKADLTSAP